MRKPTTVKAKWTILTLAIALATVVPSVASAYWGCVSYAGAGCSTWEWCTEYDDCSHQATGRMRVTLHMDNC